MAIRTWNRGVVAVNGNIAENPAGSLRTISIAHKDELLGEGVAIGANFSGYLQYAEIAQVAPTEGSIIPGNPETNTAASPSADEVNTAKTKIRELLGLSIPISGSIASNGVVNTVSAIPELNFAYSEPDNLTRLQLVLTCEPLADDFRWFDGVAANSIIPLTDNTQDLGKDQGADKKRFRDLHLGRNAAIGGTLNADGTITTGAGLIVPQDDNLGGVVRIGGNKTPGHFYIAGVDTPIAAAPAADASQAVIDADPNKGRLISAHAVRAVIDALDEEIMTRYRYVARYENAAPPVPGANNVWPTPGLFFGQKWIHGNDEYTWLRTGGEDDDAEANKFPAVRWAQTKGAVRIWLAGTSTAGELDDISTAGSYFYVKTAAADRAWTWTDFLLLEFSAEGDWNPWPITSTAKRFNAAGGKISYGDVNGSPGAPMVIRTGDSSFRIDNPGDGRFRDVSEIYGVL